MKNPLTAHNKWHLKRHPSEAIARVHGSKVYPEIRGRVSFHQTPMGVIVTSKISGLPSNPMQSCDHPVFAMHIHTGGSCSGAADEPFADTKGHFNPEDCEHPAHAGDLPPLFGNNGIAWCSVLTNRFSVPSVIGKTVIIHREPDDFTTQPSGNSGAKIACGVIKAKS